MAAPGVMVRLAGIVNAAATLGGEADVKQVTNVSPVDVSPGKPLRLPGRPGTEVTTNAAHTWPALKQIPLLARDRFHRTVDRGKDRVGNRG